MSIRTRKILAVVCLIVAMALAVWLYPQVIAVTR